MYIHKVHKKMFRVIFFFIMRVEHDNLPRFFRAAFFLLPFRIYEFGCLFIQSAKKRKLRCLNLDFRIKRSI